MCPCFKCFHYKKKKKKAFEISSALQEIINRPFSGAFSNFIISRCWHLKSCSQLSNWTRHIWSVQWITWIRYKFMWSLLWEQVPRNRVSDRLRSEKACWNPPDGHKSSVVCKITKTTAFQGILISTCVTAERQAMGKMACTLAGGIKPKTRNHHWIKGLVGLTLEWTFFPTRLH